MGASIVMLTLYYVLLVYLLGPHSLVKHHSNHGLFITTNLISIISTFSIHTSCSSLYTNCTSCTKCIKSHNFLSYLYIMDFHILYLSPIINLYFIWLTISSFVVLINFTASTILIKLNYYMIKDSSFKLYLAHKVDTPR